MPELPGVLGGRPSFSRDAASSAFGAAFSASSAPTRALRAAFSASSAATRATSPSIRASRAAADVASSGPGRAGFSTGAAMRGLRHKPPSAATEIGVSAGHDRGPSGCRAG